MDKVKNQRPVFLNLFQIKFPPPAIVSILHRISGVLIFLALPLFLWMLSKTLSSESEFQSLTQNSHPLWWFSLWVGLSAVLFHLVAGIRHLLMDIGWGESLKAGRISAYLVLIIGALCVILAGIWL